LWRQAVTGHDRPIPSVLLDSPAWLTTLAMTPAGKFGDNGVVNAAPTILCVDPDLPILETRCAVLRTSGYDAIGAPPQLAEIVLSGRKFDLVILSNLSDYQRDQITNLADGAQLLVLGEGVTMPLELLDLVAERLPQRPDRRA
jgi:hypothetical protein